MKIFFLFSVLTVGGILWGQDGRGPGGSYIRISPALRALDTDGDGAISGKEIENAPAALRTLDRNGDGMLTEDEVRPDFAGGGGRGRGRGDNRDAGGPSADDLLQTLMAFDKDHDGKLSRSELPERMQGMFDRGDTNKDGFLTADEIRAMANAQAPPQNGPEGGMMGSDPALMALDSDHDGVISAAEIRDSAAALRTLDKNGDGQLTEEEVRPAFGRGRGRGGPPPDRR